jgi:hypothetical protein
MKRGIRIFGLAAIVGLMLAAVGAVSANNSWGNYHWARQSNPFNLNLGDNLASKWDPYLATASSDWSASAVLDTTVVPGAAGNVRNCTPPSGRVEVCNAKYGFNGWLGVAGIYIDSNDHILRGYVKLNDSYFNTSTYNTAAWRRLVACQEVGHAFGLDHQDETNNNVNLGTCMDYTNDPDGGAGGASSNDPSNEHPNQHDYDQLATIYAHLDGTSTIAASSPAGPGAGNGNAGNAGADEHGLPSWAAPANGHVYVTDLGHGQKLIVHVFWVQAGQPGAR